MPLFLFELGGLVFSTDIQLKGVPKLFTNRLVEVSICKKDIIKQKDATVAHKLSRFGVNPSVYNDGQTISFDWQEHGIFEVENGKNIYYNSTAAASAFFQHFLLNEVIGTVFFQRGFFLLHASAALLPKGKAAVIFGEPGAGKSTTLGFLVKNGSKVLSDEIVIIGFDSNNKPIVLPFLPALRLWDSAFDFLGFDSDSRNAKKEINVDHLFANKSVEIECLIALKLDTKQPFSINENKGQMALIELLGNLPIPDTILSLKENFKRFEDGGRIINQSKFYSISRNQNSFEQMQSFILERLLLG